jgi:hypothetical protein
LTGLRELVSRELARRTDANASRYAPEILIHRGTPEDDAKLAALEAKYPDKIIVVNRSPVWSKNPSDRLFMRPLDDNNVGARPIARGIGRAAHDRGPGSEEIAGRCPFLGGCAPHDSGQRIHSAPAAANARQRG